MSAAAADVSFAVHAACLRGVEAIPVTVEVSLSGGIPGICIVGLGDAAVPLARLCRPRPIGLAARLEPALAHRGIDSESHV